MRESVFAALQDLSQRSFLDMFSGSGIIALEAASRGAYPVELVEQDIGKRKTLLANAAIAPARIRCRFMAAELYVRRARQGFDVIFCDPPFPYRFKWELVGEIACSPLMQEGSLLLIHRPREEPPPPLPMKRLDSKTYGRSVVDFFMHLT
jgi:16S rRNA (guanine(966)-N(2))-methyltransferase RsmD